MEKSLDEFYYIPYYGSNEMKLLKKNAARQQVPSGLPEGIFFKEAMGCPKR
jgi:hypothetical protein